MKTQITKLENQVLKAIQHFTSEDFSSDDGNWAYVHELSDSFNPFHINTIKLRGLLTTLQTKNILDVVIQDKDCGGSYVVIRDNFYKETGNDTNAGSPEIEFNNLKVK
jgi:hypothetical protein